MRALFFLSRFFSQSFHSFRSLARSLTSPTLFRRLPNHIKNNNLNSFACKMKLTHIHKQSEWNRRTFCVHDVRLRLPNEYFVQVFSINVAARFWTRVYVKCTKAYMKITRVGALTIHTRLDFLRSLTNQTGERQSEQEITKRGRGRERERKSARVWDMQNNLWEISLFIYILPNAN